MLAGPVSHTDSNICKQVSPNCRRALGRLVHSQTNAPVRIGDYFGLDFVNNACTNLCTGYDACLGDRAGKHCYAGGMSHWHKRSSCCCFRVGMWHCNAYMLTDNEAPMPCGMGHGLVYGPATFIIQGMGLAGV